MDDLDRLLAQTRQAPPTQEDELSRILAEAQPQPQPAQEDELAQLLAQVSTASPEAAAIQQEADQRVADVEARARPRELTPFQQHLRAQNPELAAEADRNGPTEQQLDQRFEQRKGEEVARIKEGAAKAVASASETWADWAQRMVTDSHVDVASPQTYAWIEQHVPTAAAQWLTKRLAQAGEGALTVANALDIVRRAGVDLTDDVARKLGLNPEQAEQTRAFIDGATIVGEVVAGGVGVAGAAVGTPGIIGAGVRRGAGKLLGKTDDAARAAVSAGKATTQAGGKVPKLSGVEQRASMEGTEAVLRKSADDILSAPLEKRIAELTDALHPIKAVGAKQGYQDARLLAGVQGQIAAAFEKGMLRLDDAGNYHAAGISLREVFEGVDDFDKMGKYFVARRAHELMMQGKKVPLSPVQISKNIALANDNHALSRSFERWQQYNSEMLDLAEATGLISARTKGALLSTGADYVPMMRELTEGTTATGGKKAVRPLKSMGEGSEAGVVRAPVETIPHVSAAWIEAGVKNRAMISVVDGLKEAGVSDDVLRRVSGIKMAEPVSGEARVMLREAGLSNSDDLISVFNRDLPEDVVQIFRNGKRELYKVGDPLLVKSFQALTPAARKGWAKLFGGFSDVLRVGVTTNPAFIARNLVRDTLTTAIQTEHGVIPLYDTLKGLASRAVKDDAYWEFMANGGGFASRTAREFGDPKTAERAARWLSNAGIRARIVADPKKIPEELFGAVRRAAEGVGEYSEMANRLAEFKRATAAGISPRVATLAAREVSTDFALRGGNEMLKGAASSIPFLNAAAQGALKGARTVASGMKMLSGDAGSGCIGTIRIWPPRPVFMIGRPSSQDRMTA